MFSRLDFRRPLVSVFVLCLAKFALASGWTSLSDPMEYGNLLLYRRIFSENNVF